MRQTRFKLMAALFAAFILSLASAGVVSAVDPLPPVSKHSKLSSPLAHLVEASQSLPQGAPFTKAQAIAAQPQLNAYLSAGLMRLDDLGRVQVYIHLEAPDANAFGELESRGAVIENQDETGILAQASVAIGDLPRVAELESVRAVTLPKYGRVNIGSRMTEGDGLLDFDDLRAAFGTDGSGVTVGVMSDGIFGLADAIAAGDLPATSFNRVGGKLVATTGGVIATSFRADSNLEGGLGSQPGAEGTAMLEIVHDIAPGAQLRFANFGTSLEFIQAVDFLAANSDVVVDDIGWFGFAYDQSSPISSNTATELNRAANPIRGYYTSVGNQARVHYQETYLDSGTDGTALTGSSGNFHRFAATSSTTDCLGLGPSTANRVRLGPGRTAVIYLTWNDSFGATTTDFDLYVFDFDTGALVEAGIDDNPGVTHEPVESVAFKNSTASSRSYNVMIRNFENASAPKTFDMFILGGASLSCAEGTDFNFNTLGSSVAAQSDAGGGVVSVGAINASEPGADAIASYSSRGPANNGAAKPDVTAIDGVLITGSGGFGSPFYGTSAAAPHVAGLAALLLEQRADLKSGGAGDDPSADRTALRNAILGSAVDLGSAGVDNIFGSGRVNGMSAALSLGAALPTPTPIPTPTLTATPQPIPSASSWGLAALGAAFGVMALLLRARRRAN